MIWGSNKSKIKLKNKIINICVMIILIIGSLPFVFNFGSKYSNVTAEIITVNDDGGGDYFKIQDAINSSKSGDTIKVWAGTYYENIVITKSITLLGNGSDNTTINGNRKGDVVYISASHVNITGFTITNSGNDQWEDSGIELNGALNCILSNINCSFNNFYGIYIYKSKHNTILNCTCIKNSWWAGIFLYYSHNNKIHNNTCSNHENGIVLEFSDNNIISNNICTNNQAGISLDNQGNIVINNNCSNNNYPLGLSFLNTGIYFRGSYHTIKNNTCYSNEDSGIKSRESSSCIIDNNKCFNSENGIELNKQTDLIISNNTIYSNNTNIRIDSGTSITVENNLCISDKYAIGIIRSETCWLKNNSMIENGIIIEGYSKEHWITHSIDTSNTVNDKSVYFYKHRSGNISPANPGQIILANCNNCTIENYFFNNTSVCIGLGFSNNIMINNNTCVNSEYGIYLSNSNNSFINKNKCTNSSYGIYLENSNYNILKYNNISKAYLGIYLHVYSVGNNITKNICDNNKNGIYIAWRCKKNILNDNYCSMNNNGLYLGNQGNNNKIVNCTFILNENGMELSDSHYNTIKNNKIIHNNHIGINFERYPTNNEISFNDFINNSYYAVAFLAETFGNKLNNKIHHNNFINNNRGRKQAEDRSVRNFWNATNEGNYWADWITPDNNNDGIVDIPYNITGNTHQKDYYPLTYLINHSDKKKDKDEDRLPDDWEEKYGFNSSSPDDPQKDSDNDNSTNLEEYLYNTDPRDRDSDDDGLIDGDEIKKFHTNPLIPDTDGDNYSDCSEIENETNPLNKTDYPDLDTPKPEKNDEKKFQKIDYTIFIILGVTIVLILIILAITMNLKRKKHKK